MRKENIMQKRYIHGLAVCYACDESQIGACTICQTGVCNKHIAPNTLEVYLCPGCKEKMLEMAYQEMRQRVKLISDFRTFLLSWDASLPKDASEAHIERWEKEKRNLLNAANEVLG